ncbi:hypothetical protein CMO91_04600 [Candidatus Woesearchaeota archaeon]|nr:hypothetical protein [Candidatus Woesearchaeota archaeon]|tara:strand:- start:273 stop:587 length:315 start_codon:yes stop_codon:yes gene_type:complete
MMEAFAQVGPIYNLILVVVVIALFVKLLRAEAYQHVYTKPWKLIFVGVIIFVVESVITVLRNLSATGVGRHINGFFELAIVILFIHALLLQKEDMKQERLLKTG